MTVRDLITQLQDCDPDATVHLAYDYGDHWHTRVAPKVQEVDLGLVAHSEYHQMYKVVEEDEPEGDKKKAREAVIIS